MAQPIGVRGRIGQIKNRVRGLALQRRTGFFRPGALTQPLNLSGLASLTNRPDGVGYGYNAGRLATVTNGSDRIIISVKN